MSHLSDEQLKVLSDLLDEREEALTTDVHQHADRFRASIATDPSSPPGDVADQAQVGMVRENENAAVGRDVRELRDIELARERIARGDAGICVDCEVEIPFERLRAQPTASRCVRCQELYERTHAQTLEP